MFSLYETPVMLLPTAPSIQVTLPSHPGKHASALAIYQLIMPIVRGSHSDKPGQ